MAAQDYNTASINLIFAEQLICSLSAQHDRYEAYVRCNDTLPADVIFKLYVTPSGGVRGLVAIGKINQLKNATRILWEAVDGSQDVFIQASGALFELVVLTNNSSDVGKNITATLCGYDTNPNLPNTTANGSSVLRQTETILATINNAHKYIDVQANLVNARQFDTQFLVYATPGTNGVRTLIQSIIIPKDNFGLLRIIRITDCGANRFEIVGKTLDNIVTGTISVSIVGSDGNSTSAGGGGEISVATLADLQNTNGSYEGQTGFVQTVLGKFNFTNNSTLAADGRTVLLTPAGGNTRWLFDESFSHPKWRIGNDDFYLDSTGNIENTGLSALSPIPALEFQRRWGRNKTIYQSGIDPEFSITLNIVGNGVVDPDILELDQICNGNTYLRIIGTITTTASGALTAVTTENQPINIPWDVTFASAIPAGSRVRCITAGVNFDAVMYVAKVIAGNQRRVSHLALNTETTFLINPVDKTPAVGNDFVIDTLPSLNLGRLFIDNKGQPNGGFGGVVNFKDLRIRIQGENGAVYQRLVTTGVNSRSQIQFVFYQCIFENSIEANLGTYFSNCLFNGFAGTQQYKFMDGSGVTGGLFLDTLIHVENPNGELVGLVNFQIQGGRIVVHGIGSIGNIGIFDGAVSGIEIGNGSDEGHPSRIKLNDRIWGSGNAGNAVDIYFGCGAICKHIATAPTIISAGQNFALAGSAVAFYFDPNPAAGTPNYKPAAGQACTWALFNAAKGAPGYGNSAHNPDGEAFLICAP